MSERRAWITVSILTIFSAALVSAVSAAEDRSGIYRGDKLTIDLKRDGSGTYVGTIKMGDQSFPLTARDAAGGIAGSFSARGASFDFIASVDGEAMTLTSDTARHTLKRAGNPLDRPGDTNPVRPANPQPADGNAANVLRFRRISVTDDRGMIGGEAFSFLAPVDWKFEGGISWRAHVSSPAILIGRVRNPNGPEQLEVFPQMPFVDGVRESAGRAARIAGPEAVAAAMAPWGEGANYAGNEVRRVVQDPAIFIEQFVLTRCRRGLRYQVVKKEGLPKIADAVQAAAAQTPGLQTGATAGRVRIAYSEGGQDVEEDVYVVMYFSHSPQMQVTFWGTQSCFGIRAGKGQLDSRETVFRTILDSTRPNLKWFSKYQQVVQMLVEQKIQEIKAVGELSKYIARTNDQISDIIVKGYNERQASQDRINDNFSQYIRGVDAYKIGSTSERVDLPSGYKDAWYNSAKDEYIVSDSTLFDPNVTVGGTWEKLQKK